MNKLTKATIAGVAGIALLLGGAGSLAYWNDSATAAGTTINSGSLSVAAPAGTWDNTYTTWVPGNSATYSTTVTVVAQGDSIKADLTLDQSSIGLGALANALSITFEATGTLPANVTDSGSGVYRITGPDTYVIPVTVKVEFPFGTAVENLTQNGSVDFTGVKFNVTQVA